MFHIRNGPICMKRYANDITCLSVSVKNISQKTQYLFSWKFHSVIYIYVAFGYFFQFSLQEFFL